MRTTRIALALAALSAAGCGSSSNDGGGPTELTGTIRGQPFTVVEAAFAGPEASNDCSIEVGLPAPLPYAPSSVLIGFSKSPGLCQTLTTPCAMKKSFGLVGGLLVHARIGQPGTPVTAPPLDAAGYTVVTDPSSLTPDATGAVRVGIFSANETDDACVDKASIDATGTATVTAISANEIRGSLDLTFTDGGTLKGPFVAQKCAVTYDACDPAPPVCNGTPTCN
ncbi:conserved hypothetical protein [Anaeromyxobacter dehalogenans 2CP-1]|uniref:Lipoprotein n=1 Tax=Anaeromyxobacter dehalogenans (strain ATCC BAA-258 / DSM 21875 / 2CP-1) TaxID=455488 RepID=B8JAQ5_ANAD2|nr:hypothetical protein [Anaeromyxobacter dehalogenans]ACL67554.1 conserved hypothetical protein [Anaeromyxobacter dehalogenans 2CP-1]